MAAIEFTKDEMSKILDWAADAADKARGGRAVNTYLYETAKSVWDKVFSEYTKREG